MAAATPLVLREMNGNVAVLKINRPEAMNALNGRVLEELERAVRELGSDPAAAVIVITGAGEKAFVAGADISEMANLDPAGGKAFGERGHRVFNAIERCPKPVIAAINGFALGGGCELAMACDIRYASAKAKLGQPEVNLGIIPGFAGTQRLARLVGKGKAKELIFSAGMLTAQEAKEIGLVDRVVEPEKLMEEALKLAQTIAAKGPLAVQAAKRLIDRGVDSNFDQGSRMELDEFGKLFSSQDQKEGMKAFLEKRPPKFTGK